MEGREWSRAAGRETLLESQMLNRLGDWGLHQYSAKCHIAIVAVVCCCNGKVTGAYGREMATCGEGRMPCTACSSVGGLRGTRRMRLIHGWYRPRWTRERKERNATQGLGKKRPEVLHSDQEPSFPLSGNLWFPGVSSLFTSSTEPCRETRKEIQNRIRS